jgi:hypothetical protein
MARNFEGEAEILPPDGGIGSTGRTLTPRSARLVIDCSRLARENPLKYGSPGGANDGKPTRPAGAKPATRATPESLMRVRLSTPAKNERSMKASCFQELTYNRLPRSRARYADPRSVPGVLHGPI